MRKLSNVLWAIVALVIFFLAQHLASEPAQPLMLMPAMTCPVPDCSGL